MVHVHFGEDAGDCQGVRDVGLAGLPALSSMGIFRKVIGPPDLRDLIRGEVTLKACCERVDCQQGRATLTKGLEFPAVVSKIILATQR